MTRFRVRWVMVDVLASAVPDQPLQARHPRRLGVDHLVIERFIVSSKRLEEADQVLAVFCGEP